ncbi:MAG: hypothetical protein CEE38_16005 [Planctomycetes bacterium B3_Pla]|nr:MAG: hypothetical protein CEE38_16005 [Planctomycetes bacterium B3_Pla]
MSKARAKPGQGGSLEQLRPKKTEEDGPGIGQSKLAGEKPEMAAQWWKKPRMVQFNAGRFEFSVPYQLAIALALGFVLMVLASYRLGQGSVARPQVAGELEGKPLKAEQEDATQRAAARIMEPAAPRETVEREVVAPPSEEEVEPAKPMGSNVIVLAQLDRSADLAPVKDYFALHGIELEIKPEGGRYFLQTKERYDNPATPGTDGHEALRKIIEVGAKYEAPAGFDSFARHLFSDAYGKKVE